MTGPHGGEEHLTAEVVYPLSLNWARSPSYSIHSRIYSRAGLPCTCFSTLDLAFVLAAPVTLGPLLGAGAHGSLLSVTSTTLAGNGGLVVPENDVRSTSCETREETEIGANQREAMEMGLWWPLEQLRLEETSYKIWYKSMKSVTWTKEVV